MELIVAILEWLARQPDPWAKPPTKIEGHDAKPAVVDYHVALCVQANLLERCTRNSHVRLTWAGHDKLDELRIAADRSVSFVSER